MHSQKYRNTLNLMTQPCAMQVPPLLFYIQMQTDVCLWVPYNNNIMVLVTAQISGQPRASWVHSSPEVRIYREQRMLHSFWSVKRNGGTSDYCCGVLCNGYLPLPLEKGRGKRMSHHFEFWK